MHPPPSFHLEQRMSRRKGKSSRPCFFKVLSRTDFRKLVRLPDVFMRKYGSMLAERVKLRLTEESGRTWKVKVEALHEDDDVFAFTTGWTAFATDVGLKFREFLVFTLDAGFVDVTVFETNGCRKNFPELEEEDEEEEEEEERNPLCYQIVLKHHHKYRLTLRSMMVRAACLVGSRRVKVVGEHQAVYVQLFNNTHTNENRFDLADGWSSFRIANRLVYGKTYSIEFPHNKNLIIIKEVQCRQPLS